MSSYRFAPVRLALIAWGCALSLQAAHAQAPAQPAPAAPQAAAAAAESEPLEGRRNQRVEHLHTEDSGAAVDETRYGGRTEQITVTPKSGMPAYQVLPTNPNRQDGAHSNGPRVWNVLKF